MLGAAWSSLSPGLAVSGPRAAFVAIFWALLSVAPCAHQSFQRDEAGSGHWGRARLAPVVLPSCCHRSEMQSPPFGQVTVLGVTCPTKGKSHSLGCQMSHRVSVTARCTGESSGHLQAPSPCGSPTLACLPVPEVTGTVTALGHPSVQSDVCLMVWDEQRVPSQ